MARGFSQKEGIDYEETFAPVARYTSIRIVLALVAVIKWKIHQMDVKTAFVTCPNFVKTILYYLRNNMLNFMLSCN